MTPDNRINEIDIFAVVFRLKDQISERPDIFLGITTYSLQNHLRTTVKGMGQIEIDELYVGIDRGGRHYVVPVQAKGGKDKLGVVQAKQDVAWCQQKFSGIKCRAISVQFMAENRIAMFELSVEGDLVKVQDTTAFYRPRRSTRKPYGNTSRTSPMGIAVPSA